MTRGRLFNIASLLSLLICLAMAPVWILSEQIGSFPSRDGLYLTSNMRVQLVDGWIVFFDHSTPVFNGIAGTSPTGGQPVRPKGASFPGLDFRYITWSGQVAGGTYWTFAISPVYPMCLSAILPAMWLMKFSRARRFATGNLCPTCSYNLTGNVSGICPECGELIMPGKSG